MSLKDKIKKLINVIEDTDINEIEVSSFWGAQKIRLSKKQNQPVNVVSDSNLIPQQKQEVIDPVNPPVVDGKPKEENPKSDVDKNDANPVVDNSLLIYQKAPLVGTFYASPKPGEPSFVKVGDKVTKGQTLCIIEAMKIFNEIESDYDGEIVEILVSDSSPVEFNQSLFSIKEN